jgi:hypothetical protein
MGLKERVNVFAKQVLSQLSYTPMTKSHPFKSICGNSKIHLGAFFVGRDGRSSRDLSARGFVSAKDQAGGRRLGDQSLLFVGDVAFHIADGFASMYNGSFRT